MTNDGDYAIGVELGYRAEDGAFSLELTSAALQMTVVLDRDALAGLGRIIEKGLLMTHDGQLNRDD